MPTPPFALPLNFAPHDFLEAFNLLDANNNQVAIVNRNDQAAAIVAAAIVAAVNRVAVLEQALRDLLHAADNSNCDSLVCDAARAALKD